MTFLQRQMSVSVNQKVITVRVCLAARQLGSGKYIIYSYVCNILCMEKVKVFVCVNVRHMRLPNGSSYLERLVRQRVVSQVQILYIQRY